LFFTVSPDVLSASAKGRKRGEVTKVKFNSIYIDDFDFGCQYYVQAAAER
ncbi:hypothetical protein P041_01902, partial [Brucella sp. 04-5288]